MHEKAKSICHKKKFIPNADLISDIIIVLSKRKEIIEISLNFIQKSIEKQSYSPGNENRLNFIKNILFNNSVFFSTLY